MNEKVLLAIWAATTIAGCSKPDVPNQSSASSSPPVVSTPPPSPVVSAAASVVAALPGNAAAGMPKATELLPLAEPGRPCAKCFFNGRCALLTTGDSKLACCDYANGNEPDAWSSGTGVAAQCLAMIADAPISPAPAKGKLLALARAGETCRECFFNGRCALLVDGRASDKLPCCDYAHGKSAGAWKDDSGAARCLSLEVGAKLE